jgi:DnaJ-class molecular chaperone
MAIKHTPLEKCPECGGTTYIKCRPCSGTGFDPMDSGQCENCDGSGEVDCDNPECNNGFVTVE